MSCNDIAGLNSSSVISLDGDDDDSRDVIPLGMLEIQFNLENACDAQHGSEATFENKLNGNVTSGVKPVKGVEMLVDLDEEDDSKEMREEQEQNSTEKDDVDQIDVKENIVRNGMDTIDYADSLGLVPTESNKMAKSRKKVQSPRASIGLSPNSRLNLSSANDTSSDTNPLPDDSPLWLPLKLGWQREVVYRATPNKHNKVDIYYRAPPTGKKLRSMVDISKALVNMNSELTVANFTFLRKSLGINDPEKEIIRNAKPPTPRLSQPDGKPKVTTPKSSPKPPPKNKPKPSPKLIVKFPTPKTPATNGKSPSAIRLTPLSKLLATPTKKNTVQKKSVQKACTPPILKLPKILRTANSPKTPQILCSPELLVPEIICPELSRNESPEGSITNLGYHCYKPPSTTEKKVAQKRKSQGTQASLIQTEHRTSPVNERTFDPDLELDGLVKIETETPIEKTYLPAAAKRRLLPPNYKFKSAAALAQKASNAKLSTPTSTDSVKTINDSSIHTNGVINPQKQLFLLVKVPHSSPAPLPTVFLPPT